VSENAPIEGQIKLWEDDIHVYFKDGKWSTWKSLSRARQDAFEIYITARKSAQDDCHARIKVAQDILYAAYAAAEDRQTSTRP